MAPKKAQVGGPTRGAKPKPPLAAAAGTKKAALPKPPVTRSKTKNEPMPKKVAVVDPENYTTATVDDDCDTDELAELPTDSEPEMVESDLGRKMPKLKNNDN